MKNKFRLRGSSWLHSIYSGDRIQLITSRLRSFSLLIVLSPGSSPGSCLRGPWPGLGWLPCLYCYHCSVVQFSIQAKLSLAVARPAPAGLARSGSTPSYSQSDTGRGFPRNVQCRAAADTTPPPPPPPAPPASLVSQTASKHTRPDSEKWADQEGSVVVPHIASCVMA